MVRDAGRGGRLATLVDRVGPDRELLATLTPGSQWVEVRVVTAFVRTKAGPGTAERHPLIPRILSAYVWHIPTGTRVERKWRARVWAPDDSMFIAKDGPVARVWRVIGTRIVRGEALVKMKGDLGGAAWQP